MVYNTMYCADCRASQEWTEKSEEKRANVSRVIGALQAQHECTCCAMSTFDARMRGGREMLLSASDREALQLQHCKCNKTLDAHQAALSFQLGPAWGRPRPWTSSTSSWPRPTPPTPAFGAWVNIYLSSLRIPCGCIVSNFYAMQYWQLICTLHNTVLTISDIPRSVAIVSLLGKTNALFIRYAYKVKTCKVHTDSHGMPSGGNGLLVVASTP